MRAPRLIVKPPAATTRTRMLGALVVLATALPAAAQTTAEGSPRLRIAIFDLNLKGEFGPEVATSVSALIAAEVSQTGVFEVITQEDVRHMVSFDQMKSALSCEDESCLAEIGGALGVPYLLTGSLARLDRDLVLALSLIDIRKVRTLGRETESAPDLNALRDRLGTVVRRLLRPILFEHRGQLVLDDPLGQSTVEIDGRVVGLTPLAPLELAAGPHRLVVSHPGYVSLVKDIELQPQAVTEQPVVLVPLPETHAELWRQAFTLQMAGIGTAALGLAGLGTGAGAFVYAELLKQDQGLPLDGSEAGKTLVSQPTADTILLARWIGVGTLATGAVLGGLGVWLALLADYPEPMADAGEQAATEVAP